MIPTEGICTDAAHSTKNGVTEYRGVDLSTGKELFYRNMGNQTVNIGEFLALIDGIKYILKNIRVKRGDKVALYSDSKTAIHWFDGRYTKSNKSHPDLLKAVAFLKAMQSVISKKIEVIHWDTSQWGEIPADFGNK